MKVIHGDMPWYTKGIKEILKLSFLQIRKYEHAYVFILLVKGTVLLNKITVLSSNPCLGKNASLEFNRALPLVDSKSYWCTLQFNVSFVGFD